MSSYEFVLCKISQSFLVWLNIEMILFQIYWVKQNVLLKLISPVLFSFLNVAIRKCKCGLHRFILDRTTLDTQPSWIKCVMGKCT